MLNKLDDYPIHQTPLSIVYPASSDRNVYDRTWYNGFSTGGEYYFALGMAIYPNRSVQDASFSVVTKGGRQHCFFASRRAPTERTDMSVGPMRLEILEPMRSVRLVIDDNETGIACDLVFSARTAAIDEGQQEAWLDTRKVMDVTRFAQFGCWKGVIRHPDGELQVDETVCLGTKDRSWGLRRLGEPDKGAPVAPRSMFFLWAPLSWGDHVTHALFFDDVDGTPQIRKGFAAPRYGDSASIPGVEDPALAHMRAVHRLTYVPGTRLIERAEVDLTDALGKVRTISMEPILRFHMKGLGYFHPVWGQGMWKGELEIGSEVIDPQTLDLMAPENIHVQQVVRVSDGDRSGMGALEHICFGPYAPSGFTSWKDGWQAEK